MVPEVFFGVGRFGCSCGVVVLGVILLGKRDVRVPVRGGGGVRLNPVQCSRAHALPVFSGLAWGV